MLFVHRTEDSAGGRTIFAWPVVLLVFCLERASSVGDAAAAEGEPFTLTILHINDLHSHFDPTDPYGGRCRPGMEAKCVGGAARQLYLVRRRIMRTLLAPTRYELRLPALRAAESVLIFLKSFIVYMFYRFTYCPTYNVKTYF